MTFNSAALVTYLEPKPQNLPGQARASFASRRPGRAWEALLSGRGKAGVSVSPEDHMKALQAVFGQGTVADLLEVGWNDDQLTQVIVLSLRKQSHL